MSEDRTREELETSKQRAIVYREWAYFGMAGLFCLMMVWALWSWKQTNNMVAASHAKLDTIIDRLGEKLDAVQIERFNVLVTSGNELIASGKDRVDELGQTERELTALVTDTRRNTGRLTDSVITRMDRVQDNLDSLRAVTDQTASTVKQLGDATERLMSRYGLTADEATQAIRTASEKTGLSMDELKRQIADPRWQKAADNLVAATGEADRTLVDFHAQMNATLAEMPGIARDVHKTTTTISRFARISIVTSIISRLAAAFIPGLLN